MFLAFNPSPTLFVLIVILGLFALALAVVGILKFIQITKKQIKRNQKAKAKKPDELLLIFGGEENIENIGINLNTVTIKVVDKEKVDFAKIKELKIGCQIINNIVKCSSSYLAEALKDYKKGE